MSGVANNAAGQAYYESLVKLYAEWGVDFIKMDCAYHADYETEQLQIVTAIRGQEREFVLSMSPTDRDPEFAKAHELNSSMYRINGEQQMITVVIKIVKNIIHIKCSICGLYCFILCGLISAAQMKEAKPEADSNEE